MIVELGTLPLRDSPVISPPSIDPAWRCGTAVVLHGFIPDALLDIEIGGTMLVTGQPGGLPVPAGARVALPRALAAGETVRARQTFDGITSAWAEVVVRDHSIEYPAGPPRPRIDPTPLFQCGRRVGVANLLVGCDVSVAAAGVELGRVAGAVQHQGVDVAPPFRIGEEVVASASLCGDPSPPSEARIVERAPRHLPTPVVRDVVAGGRQLTIQEVANGATVEIRRDGVPQFRTACWGGTLEVALDTPLTEGERLSAVQQLCAGDAPSLPGETIVGECGRLGAPVAAPVGAGDTSVTLTVFQPDARIRVFVNLVKTGDGSGPVLRLTEPVPSGSTIHILQSVGTCVSPVLREVAVRCHASRIAEDPSELNLFPVGTATYDGGMTRVMSGRAHRVAGTLFYPAEADGADAEFNRRRAALGPLPLVLLVHGRHGGDDSHLGYDYLQRRLARMGIIAASVDCNESNRWGGDADNIRDRADIVMASIAHLQSLNGGADPLLGGRIAFDNVALMGHSRGGDAVVLVPHLIVDSGLAITIKGVLALAPTLSGAVGGPGSHPFMTILPACDGDVIENDGARFYDRTTPSPFKSQLYVRAANHNYFNRRWLNDDARDRLRLISRGEHERILSIYGCAFFRSVLLGHRLEGFLDGSSRTGDEIGRFVHLSYAREGQVIVDDHEIGTDIGRNALGGRTSQSGGLTASEHQFAQGGSSFNRSFFGSTNGMVARATGTGGEFRSPFDRLRDLTGKEVWIRTAQVYEPPMVRTHVESQPMTGFRLGLEDERGEVAWVDSDGVGGLPRPVDRTAFDTEIGDRVDRSKTMPSTLRFPIGCFNSPGATPFERTRVVAIRLNLNRDDNQAIAFDDLQIVTP